MQHKDHSIDPWSEAISANQLSRLIKGDIASFDYTASTEAVKRHWQHVTRKRISFSTLLVAMLLAGFAVVPQGSTFRFLAMQDISDAQ